MTDTRLIGVALLLAVGVSACGGGGGGGGSPPPSGPVTSTLTFPLRSGWNTRIANGQTTTLTANGTPATQTTDGLCSGTATETVGPATTVTTFEGAPALSAVTVFTNSFTNCVPASQATTGTSYYDSNYLPLGFNIQGGDYGVFLTPPTIPNSVKVGDVAIIGTETLYTNSTKAVGTGRQDLSIVVEPDTASTAIVNLIFKEYNVSSQLLSTEQDRYRITSTGALTLVSVDIQYATTSTLHLVFR